MNSINSELTAIGVPMDRLTRFIATQTRTPVADKTGLKGIYSFHLKWQREEEGPASGLHDQALPTIYAALPEQLGLKLESGKGSVDVLVVDHIEQPSERIERASAQSGENRMNGGLSLFARRWRTAMQVVCVCLVLAAQALWAAEYHGRVQYGGVVVPGATVTLTQGSTELTTVTDSQGLYEFPKDC